MTHKIRLARYGRHPWDDTQTFIVGCDCQWVDSLVPTFPARHTFRNARHAYDQHVREQAA